MIEKVAPSAMWRLSPRCAGRLVLTNSASMAEMHPEEDNPQP
jgi:hypothetical protein